jgi:hypothetical protein
MFDRMDGFQMLSMRGPVTFKEDEDERGVEMEFRGGSPQMQHSSAAFSAASRDPLGRFGSLRQYMDIGHEEEYPCCLCIRVTLRDMRTGKMALVLEVNKGTAYRCIDQGSDPCFSFTGLQRCANAIGRLFSSNYAYFSMTPEVGQGEAVSMQDRLYRVRPRDFSLKFCVDDHESLTLDEFKGVLQPVMT